MKDSSKDEIGKMRRGRTKGERKEEENGKGERRERENGEG